MKLDDLQLKLEQVKNKIDEAKTGRLQLHQNDIWNLYRVKDNIECSIKNILEPYEGSSYTKRHTPIPEEIRDISLENPKPDLRTAKEHCEEGCCRCINLTSGIPNCP